MREVQADARSLSLPHPSNLRQVDTRVLNCTGICDHEEKPLIVDTGTSISKSLFSYYTNQFAFNRPFKKRASKPLTFVCSDVPM